MRGWYLILLFCLLPYIGAAQTLYSLSLSPSAVVGGTNCTGTVTLSAAAPSGGVVISLSSNSSSARTPKSVVAPSGATTVSFTVQTAAVTANTPAVISATLGMVTKTRTLAVNAPTLSSFALNPSSVTEGALSMGTVILSGAAPEGGVTIALSSSATYATPPPSVTIPAGSLSTTFTVHTNPVPATGTVTISASGGATTRKQTMLIKLPGGPSVTLIPAQVPGSNRSYAVVTLAKPAPAGGQKVSITSSSFYALAPPSVTIPPGQRSATVAIRTYSVLANLSATITAVGVGSAALQVEPSGGQPGSPWALPRGGSDNSARGVASPPNGQILWKVTTGTTIDQPVLAQDGTIYECMTNGGSGATLNAYWPNGKFKWIQDLGWGTGGPPAVGPDGTIYVSYVLGCINAYNPDGSAKWQWYDGNADGVGDYLFAPPTIGADGTVYVVSSTYNRLYAINPDGSEKWACGIGEGAYGAPALGTDGTIYVGGYDGNLYAINPNGAAIWRCGTGAAINGSPAVGPDGTIYVGTVDGQLVGAPNGMWAFTPAGAGRMLFSTTSNGICGSPAIGDDGTIYFGVTDGNMYGVGPSGSITVFQTGASVQGSPSIAADGTILVASNDGYLYDFYPDGAVKWAQFVSADDTSPTIGADGTVYVPGNDGNLYAVGVPAPWPGLLANSRHSGVGIGMGCNGKLLWSTNGGDGVFGSPVVGSSGTIFANTTGHFEAFNPDGSAAWSYFPLNSLSRNSVPAIGPDGTVYTRGIPDGTTQNCLVAFNPWTGSLLWEQPIGDSRSAPTLGPDGTLYVAGANSLFAIDHRSGNVKWSYPTGGRVNATPALGADGTVYFGSADDNVYAINAQGALEWTFPTKGIVESAAVRMDGTILVGSADGDLYALSPSGTEIWADQLGAPVYATPTIGLDGSVYVGTFNGLSAFNPDGKLEWTFPTIDPVNCGPSIGADGTLYVASDQLYALNPATGTALWEFPLAGGSIGSPAIAANGTVYIQCTSGTLYAIGTQASG